MARRKKFQKPQKEGPTVFLFKILLLCCISLFAASAWAGVTEPEPRGEDQFDFMNLLAKKGLHDLKDERWNAYGQFTYISRWKGASRALYTNLNGSNSSLLPGRRKKLYRNCDTVSRAQDME